MKKDKPQKGRFQTHIEEPKWQVIASVIIVIVLVVIELLFVLKVI